MAFGFESWDSSGKKIFEGSSSYGCTLGVIDAQAQTSGSLYSAELAKGKPFYFVVTQYPVTSGTPSVSVSGGVVSWSGGSGSIPAKIIYGVY